MLKLCYKNFGTRVFRRILRQLVKSQIIKCSKIANWTKVNSSNTYSSNNQLIKRLPSGSSDDTKHFLRRLRTQSITQKAKKVFCVLLFAFCFDAKSFCVWSSSRILRHIVQDLQGPPTTQTTLFASSADPTTQKVSLFASLADPSADPGNEKLICVLF